MPEHGAISKPEILNVVGLSSEVCSKHKAQKHAYLRVCVLAFVFVYVMCTQKIRAKNLQ